MQKYLSQLRGCPLFDRIADEDLLRTLECLRAQVVHARRDQVILHQGEPALRLGVMLRGSARVVSTDAGGNHAVVAAIGERDIFAETFACAGLSALPVSVMAAEDCTILFLEHKRVITGCRNGCMAHSYLVTNLMQIIARKNLMLSRKLTIVTQRTTREKLLAFLREQQKQTGSHRFAIPFDRQALADYLGVERSAMSAELSRMRQAGLIDYRKNEFEILPPSDEAHGGERHGLF